MQRAGWRATNDVLQPTAADVASDQQARRDSPRPLGPSRAPAPRPHLRRRRQRPQRSHPCACTYSALPLAHASGAFTCAWARTRRPRPADARVLAVWGSGGGQRRCDGDAASPRCACGTCAWSTDASVVVPPTRGCSGAQCACTPPTPPPAPYAPELALPPAVLVPAARTW